VIVTGLELAAAAVVVTGLYRSTVIVTGLELAAAAVVIARLGVPATVTLAVMAVVMTVLAGVMVMMVAMAGRIVGAVARLRDGDRADANRERRAQGRQLPTDCELHLRTLLDRGGPEWRDSGRGINGT